MRQRRNPLRMLAMTSAVVCAGHACAVDCRNVDFHTVPFSVCLVDLTTDRLENFYLNSAGRPLGSFANLQEEVRKAGRELVFAMNGGIFDKELAPVGLLVINQVVIHELNLKGWPGYPAVPGGQDGNFYTLPNAVFWIQDGHARVADSQAYRNARATPSLAIQSGPMLLSGGAIPQGLSSYNAQTFKRNGVCAPTPTTVAFAISNRSTSIWRLAQFMHDELKCDAALYLDGCRSALFSSSLGRSDPSCPADCCKDALPLGSMIGVAQSPHGSGATKH